LSYPVHKQTNKQTNGGKKLLAFFFHFLLFLCYYISFYHFGE